MVTEIIKKYQKIYRIKEKAAPIQEQPSINIKEVFKYKIPNIIFKLTLSNLLVKIFIIFRKPKPYFFFRNEKNPILNSSNGKIVQSTIKNVFGRIYQQPEG